MRPSIALVILAVLGGLTACGRNGSQASPGPPAEVGITSAGRPRTSGATVDALCRAATIAREDPARAGAVFVDEAHDALHELAAKLEAVDRSLAGRLLEAKQAVEADLAGSSARSLPAPPGPPDLAGDLRKLARAAGEGAGRLGDPVSGCAA